MAGDDDDAYAYTRTTRTTRESSFRVSTFLDFVDGTSSSSRRKLSPGGGISCQQEASHTSSDGFMASSSSVACLSVVVEEVSFSRTMAGSRSTQTILNDAALQDDVPPELDRFAYEGQQQRRRARAMAKIGAVLRAATTQIRPALLLVSALKADASPWFSLAKAANDGEENGSGGEDYAKPAQAESAGKALPSRVQLRQRRARSAIDALMEEAAGDAGGHGDGVSRPARLPPKRQRTLAAAFARVPSRLTRHTLSRLSVLHKTQRLCSGHHLHAAEEATSSPGGSNRGGSSCSNGCDSGGSGGSGGSGSSGGNEPNGGADKEVGCSISGIDYSALEDEGDSCSGRAPPAGGRRLMHSLFSLPGHHTRLSAVRASLLRGRLRASRLSRLSRLTSANAAKARPQRAGPRKEKAPQALLLPVLAEEGAASVGDDAASSFTATPSAAVLPQAPSFVPAIPPEGLPLGPSSALPPPTGLLATQASLAPVAQLLSA